MHRQSSFLVCFSWLVVVTTLILSLSLLGRELFDERSGDEDTAVRSLLTDDIRITEAEFDTSSWKECNNQSHDYTIRYPSNWDIFVPLNSTTCVRGPCVQTETCSNLREESTPVYGQKPFSYKGIWISRFRADLSSLADLSSSNHLNPSLVLAKGEFKGYPALLLSYPGAEVDGYNIVIQRNGRLLSIIVSDPNTPITRAVLNSLQFSD